LKDDVRKGGEMKKETDVSRRNFLKGSVMGAGALTAGFAGGLVLPGTVEAATPPGFPLPYCRDNGGNPTTSPASTNTTVLDPDDVRCRAWYKYMTGSG
jgi:hypothetical protein